MKCRVGRAFRPTDYTLIFLLLFSFSKPQFLLINTHLIVNMAYQNTNIKPALQDGAKRLRVPPLWSNFQVFNYFLSESDKR
jgi:hypothetical protein